MRVVLRQQETGHYLQPSGEWNRNRESARQFLSAVDAYRWAIEQEMVGTEVWLALSDARKDFPCMKVQGRLNRPVINCRHLSWEDELQTLLFSGIAVDLVNFNYDLHGESCELLAQGFSMEFNLSRDPTCKTAYFRKKTERHEREAKNPGYWLRESVGG